MIAFARVANFLAFAFAGALVTASLALAYALLAPIDVVQDWKISVEDREYALGDEFVIQASYKKVMEVTGTAYYYVDCQNQRGSISRYPISQSEGNRRAGSGSTEIPMRLPTAIPGLPARCRAAISVDYNIYTFRKFTENNESNWFTVISKKGER
ncbi:hypothetical protein ACWFRF_15390 [Nocardia sp. NPDC055165]